MERSFSDVKESDIIWRLPPSIGLPEKLKVCGVSMRGTEKYIWTKNLVTKRRRLLKLSPWWVTRDSYIDSVIGTVTVQKDRVRIHLEVYMSDKRRSQKSIMEALKLWKEVMYD